MPMVICPVCGRQADDGDRVAPQAPPPWLAPDAEEGRAVGFHCTGCGHRWTILEDVAKGGGLTESAAIHLPDGRAAKRVMAMSFQAEDDEGSPAHA